MKELCVTERRGEVTGGAVHPLTRYIMNYLSVAGDYKETLEQVFKDHSKIAPPQPWAPPPLKNNTLHSLLTPSPFFSFSTLFFFLFIEFYIIVNK